MIKIESFFEDKQGAEVASVWKYPFTIRGEQKYKVYDEQEKEWVGEKCMSIETAEKLASEIVDEYNNISWRDIVDYFNHIPANKE